MKRLVVILLILCTCITAAACGAKVEEKLPEATVGTSSETETEEEKDTETLTEMEAETEDILESETETEKLAESDTEKETETETEAPDVENMIIKNGVPYIGGLDGEYEGSITTSKGLLNIEVSAALGEVSITTRIEGSVEAITYIAYLNYGVNANLIELDIHEIIIHGYEKNGQFIPGYDMHGQDESLKGELYLYNGHVYFICTSSTLDIETDDIFFFEPNPENENEFTYAEWIESVKDLRKHNDRVYYAIRAFLENDVKSFEAVCGVNEGVYESFEGIKISEYNVYTETFYSRSMPSQYYEYIVFDFEISESNSEFLKPGKYSWLCENTLDLIFYPRESYINYWDRVESASPAAQYIEGVISTDLSFLKNLGRATLNFIVSRLQFIDNYEGDGAYYEEEIAAYAEKYLGIDKDTVTIGYCLLQDDNGKYSRLSLGGSYYQTVVSEETEGDMTVLTVKYWADPSKLVPSKIVKHYLEFYDEDFRPIKTEVLYDSGFESEFQSAS